MRILIKAVLPGIMLGIAPIVVCFILYTISPFLELPQDVFSFALMGCYAACSLAVFIMAMILLIVKNRPVTGGVAMVIMIVQLIIGVSYMAGV